jgi:hypothetical protein
MDVARGTRQSLRYVGPRDRDAAISCSWPTDQARGCAETGHVKAIDLELRISTPEGEDKLKRLVEVAERGCHIRALLRDDVTLTVNVVRV